MNKRVIKLTVNDLPREVAVAPNQTLLDLLRVDLGLTGTKHGCGEGDCGACVVLLDRLPVNACLVLALDAEGRVVQTIEGVADGPNLHPVQQAFLEAGAVQCGYCTPGMILTAKAFLDSHPQPTEEEIRRSISGNLCRCTGYQKIVEAIVLASQRMEQTRAGQERADQGGER